jgi:hypothetical protein
MMFVSSTSTRQVPLEELELLITELQSSLPDGFVFYLFMVFLLVLFFMGRDGFTLLNLCFILLLSVLSNNSDDTINVVQ